VPPLSENTLKESRRIYRLRGRSASAVGKYSERKKQNISAARQRFVRCTRQQTDWDRQPAGGVKVSTGIGKFVKHAESA